MMNNPDSPEMPIKLLRTAKGKRPNYFSDPDVDRLLAMIVPLIGEVSVLRDRLDTVERLAEKHDLFAQNEIEKFDPSAAEKQARDDWRAQYLSRIFRITQSELEEATAGRGVDLDEVIEDFTAGKI